MKEFKDRLKAGREACGLSQAALAEAVGISTRTIQNYELGKRYPRNMQVAQSLANALELPVTELLGNAGTYVVEAQERGGARARRDVEGLVQEISGLFAGGELGEEDIDAVMLALQTAYWKAKKKNKKFAPKKYQQQDTD